MTITPPRLLVLCLPALSLLLMLSGSAQVGFSMGSPFPGKKTVWNGYDRYDFQVDGRGCFVIVPKKAAPGKPWVWPPYCFAGNACDLSVLENGVHIAVIDMADMYGSPTAMKHMDAFYEVLTKQYGLSKKVVLEGYSRGGLYAFNWAARHPDCVACIFAVVPVCDIKSWPGGKFNGTGNPGDWPKLLKIYGMTEAEAMAYRGNPIDNLEPLAKSHIPLLHVVGDDDVGVPVAENTAIVEKRYKELGGSITVIHRPGCGHVFVIEGTKPIVDFILGHMQPDG